MTIPFTPAVIQPSRDLFSMDKVPFPRVLRDRITQAELQKERGELSGADYDTLVQGMVEVEMQVQHLAYSDGWMWYDTPPARHNPQGLSMVWWRFR